MRHIRDQVQAVRQDFVQLDKTVKNELEKVKDEIHRVDKSVSSLKFISFGALILGVRTYLKYNV